MTARGADSSVHEPGPERDWTESWYVDFASDDGSVGGFARIGVLPNERCAWCWVYLVTPDGTVAVRDHDVPLPRAPHLLARSEGLWCELVCETPMEHWAVNVEAFGVRLDDPLDGFRGEVGHRIAVGLELDWEASMAACDHRFPSPGYAHPGSVHGDILLGTEVITFAGTGMRDHSWGVLDWWAAAWNEAGVQFDGARAARVFRRDDGRAAETSVWRNGEPAARDDLELGAVPLGVAAVPLDAPDGRRARLTRSMCHFTAAGLGVGHGWAERLQVT